MPSQADIEEFQTSINALSAIAVSDAVKMAATVETPAPKDVEDALVAAIYHTIETYMTAAAELATVFYDQSLPQQLRPHQPVLLDTVTPARAGSPAPVTAAELVSAIPDVFNADPAAADLVVQVLEADPAAATDLATALRHIEPAATKTLPKAPAVERGPNLPARIVGPRSPQALSDAQAFVPRPAPLPPAEKVEQSIRWAVSAPIAPDSTATVESRLSGAVQRYVSNAARDTITTNADREGAKWGRQARPDACAFCRMLATRGADYLSEQAALRVVGRRTKSRAVPGRLVNVKRGTRDLGEKYHDHCHCTPFVVRPGDSYTPPDYVLEWERQYLSAADKSNGSTKSILSEMRKLSTGNKA
jgi:hypothetical protein